MLNSILIGLSFLFGILAVRTIRRYDIHEAEPFWKMAFVTVWGGIVSVVISLALYQLLEAGGIYIRSGIPFTYFFVGFVEELGKLAALFICWPIIKKEMDEPTDGLIYMACTALGFSLIENYFYAVLPMKTHLIFVRLLICTPMHIAFSMIMGLAFYWAMRCRGGWGMLAFVYVVASIYHALYDIVVTYWVFSWGIFFILAGALSWMYRMLSYTTAQSPFRTPLADFLAAYPPQQMTKGLECLNCGNTAPKPAYVKGRITVQRCGNCGSYVCSTGSFVQLIRHFGSLFGSVDKVIRRHAGLKKKTANPLPGVRTDLPRKLVCFEPEPLNASLEELNSKVLEETEKKWWCHWRAAEPGT